MEKSNLQRAAPSFPIPIAMAENRGYSLQLSEATHFTQLMLNPYPKPGKQVFDAEKLLPSFFSRCLSFLPALNATFNVLVLF